MRSSYHYQIVLLKQRIQWHLPLLMYEGCYLSTRSFAIWGCSTLMTVLWFVGVLKTMISLLSVHFDVPEGKEWSVIRVQICAMLSTVTIYHYTVPVWLRLNLSVWFEVFWGNADNWTCHVPWDASTVCWEGKKWLGTQIEELSGYQGDRIQGHSLTSMFLRVS